MAPLLRGEQHAAGVNMQPDPQSSSAIRHPLRKLSQRTLKPSHRTLRAVETVPSTTTTGTITQRFPARSEKVARVNDDRPAPPSNQYGHGSPGNSLSLIHTVPTTSTSNTIEPQRRHRSNSHGLSWSSNTRDSIVDNLLLSLDQISVQPIQPASASPESQFAPRSTALPPPAAMSQNSPQRSRGHAHNPSVSSEADRGDSPNRLPSQGSTHVRRPSGFSATRIMNGMKSSRLEGADHQSPETHHSRGWRSRHGSKSSEMTASTDHASASPSRMRARDASRERDFRSRNQSAQDSTTRTESPGPARPHFPTMTSQRAAAPIRKKSSKSHIELTSSPKQEASEETRNPRAEFARTTSMRSLQQQTTNSTASTPSGATHKQTGISQDEKRGFFKRVFGTSNSRSNLASPDPLPPTGSPSASRQGSVGTHQPSVSQQLAQKREPSPGPGTARELSKKTSAFFRRQKKSVTDSNEPPSLPPLHAAEINADSPARSSLYKAMDPYLASEQPTNSTPTRPQARQATYEPRVARRRLDSSPSSENTDDPDMFHSGYTQSPDAAIRAVSPEADPRRPSEALSATSIKQDASLRNASVIGATSPDPSSAEGRAEKVPHASPHSRNNSSYVDSEEHRTLVESPELSREKQNSLSSKGGIKHSLIVDTSSPTAAQGEFVVQKTANGQTEVSRVRLIPSPVEPEDDVFVTPHDKDTFSTPVKTSSSEPEPEMTARITSPVDLGLDYDSNSIPVAQPQDFESSPQLQYLHVDRSNSDATRNMSVATTGTALTSMTAIMEGPNFEDRERAASIYNGDEEFIPREQAAAYLGERKAVNVNTLQAFMDLFNFQGQTILGGMRMLCNRLVLKAESQQVDRILDCFASRWCDCNPDHGFKIKDVVHTMCYSLLLLNTDLHMADIESKMTRAQFVKNTLPTIKRVVADAPPESFEIPDVPTPLNNRPGMQWQDSTNSVNTAASNDSSGDRRKSTDSRRPTLTKRMSWSLGMGKPADEPEPQNQNPQVPNSGSTALVNEKFDGKPAEWHYELESILKSFFTAIKNEALPLNTRSGLRRTNSLKSMAPSEMSVRTKRSDFMSGRWGKGRTRSKFYASSTMASSRTSFDDGSSIFSPAGSSAWSKLSLGKTLTGTSGDSLPFGPDQSFPQNIGFANALSQNIAREEGIDDDCISINPQKFLLEDDSLELAGAPWAKEGIVKHKHHLETTERKAKERNWSECFAVIERGYLRLFSFNSKGGKSGSLGVRKSMQRGKAPSIAPSVVGGGNWMQNAEQQGSFLLRQTIASSLPPPGYSKARPHVWALSLPNGAVHLFQVGTAEIAKEFMNTANYWSARLSKEPLMGGVESTEYGWSENIILPSMIDPALIAAAQEGARPTSRGHSANNSVSVPSNNRMSVARSMRGSIDHTTGLPRVPKPGDSARIEGWKPPVQSMMASQLMEVDQLKALSDYVLSLENELSHHNELRANIPHAYAPRNPNLGRAIANWELKSAYLLREIVKFQTYIDALNLAGEEKVRIDKDRAEREAEKEEREQRKRERQEAAAKLTGDAAAADEAAAATNATAVEGTPKATPVVSQAEVTVETS